MGEVNRAKSIVATDASDWALVSLKHLTNASLTEREIECKMFFKKQINTHVLYHKR